MPFGGRYLVAARAAAGTVPLLLGRETQFRSTASPPTDPPDAADQLSWFISWKAGDKPPLSDLYQDAWGATLPVPRPEMGVLIGIRGRHTRSPADEILKRMGTEDTPARTVIDWSDRPLFEIEAELRRAAVKPDAVN